MIELEEAVLGHQQDILESEGQDQTRLASGLKPKNLRRHFRPYLSKATTTDKHYTWIHPHRR